jgi:hypothetical protein
MELAMIAVFVTLIAVAARGINFATLALLGLFFYYHPILFFSEVSWLSNGAHHSTVAESSRWLVFLLVVIYGFVALVFSPSSEIRQHFQLNKSAIRAVSNASLLIAIVFCALTLRQFQLHGQTDKATFMSNLSYELKIFEVASTFFIAATVLLGGIIRTIVCVAFVCVALLLGFRFLVLSAVVTYFVLRPVPAGRKTFFALLIILAAAFFGIVSKLFFYRFPNLDEIPTILENQLGGDGLVQNYTIANPESTTVSVVFNEVILHGFRTDLQVLSDTMLSAIPFAPLFIDIGGLTHFTDVYKAKLPVDGLWSFPGSMFAQAFSIGGEIGIFALAALHLGAIYAFTKVAKTRLPMEIRIFCIFQVSLLVVYFHRSDLSYNISLLKTGVATGALCFALTFAPRLNRLRRAFVVTSR